MSATTKGRRALVLISLLGVVGVRGSMVVAAASNVRWDGDSQVGLPGDAHTWGDANNWTVNGVDDISPSDVAPGDDITFGNGTVGTIKLGQSRNVASLYFNNGFTLDTAGSSNVLTDWSGDISVFEEQKPVTINAILAGSNGLTLQGSDLLTNVNLPANNTFTGSVNISSCTLNIVSDSNLGNSSNSLSLNNAALSIGANIHMSRGITCTGANTSFVVPTGITLTLSGTFNASAGGLTLSGGGSVSLPGLSVINSLTESSGNINFAPANSSVLVVGTLSLGSGSLDLGSSDMILHNTGPGAIDTLLATGFKNGRWTGAGLLSSAAAADPNHSHALGYMLNTSDGTGPLISSFDGQTVTASDTLVKYTFFGDANLDGKVDGSDYSRIDSGFLTRATGWYNGDFNYDGTVNGSDYTLIDNAYNMQLGNPSARPTAAVNISVPAAGAVPEPGGMIAAGGAVVLLGRRSRYGAMQGR